MFPVLPVEILSSKSFLPSGEFTTSSCAVGKYFTSSMFTFLSPTLIFVGCSNSAPTKNLKYEPVNKKLLKDIEPYSKEKVTTQDKINKQKLDENMKNAEEDREKNNLNHPYMFANDRMIK